MASTPSPSITPAQHRLGLIMLAVTAALWSLNGPLIKLLQTSPAVVDGLSIAFYRSLIAGLALSPLALRGLPSLRSARPLALLGAVIFFTSLTATFVIATTRTQAANAILLQYTSTLWVCLLSPLLLRERIRPRDLAALGGAALGIIIIFGGQFSTDLAGLLIGLTSGVCFAGVTMLLRSLRACDSAAVAWLLNCGGAAILLLPAWKWGHAALDRRAILLLIVLGVVQFGLPYYLYSWSLRRVLAYQAALITLLEPVLNPVWTYFAVGEVPTPTTLLGGLLILASLAAYIALAARSSRPSPVC